MLSCRAILIMGQSTDGQICFGIDFEEDHKFPWTHEDFDGEFDAWWEHINNYKNPYQIWKEDVVEYVDDITDELKKQYYEYRKQWLKDNPYPIELVNSCSCDYPMYILAVPSTVISCSRGYPEEIDTNLFDIDNSDYTKYDDFMIKYFPDCGQPKWYLSSLWC